VKLEQVKIGEFVINYATAGKGLPIVLIHGGNIGWGQWYPNIPELARYFKVYALDLPGGGRRSRILLFAPPSRFLYDVFMEGMRLIIAFGSRARGSAGRSSDWDVAVLEDHELGIEEKISIASAIAKKFDFPEDSLDVVDLWSAPPLLQYRVAQEGKLLHGSKVDFLRFRVLAWKRYHDTAKFRRARERALGKRYAR
jgi:predicted nucleotidyltransferase